MYLVCCRILVISLRVPWDEKDWKLLSQIMSQWPHFRQEHWGSDQEDHTALWDKLSDSALHTPGLDPVPYLAFSAVSLSQSHRRHFPSHQTPKREHFTFQPFLLQNQSVLDFGHWSNLDSSWRVTPTGLSPVDTGILLRNGFESQGLSSWC